MENEHEKRPDTGSHTEVQIVSPQESTVHVNVNNVASQNSNSVGSVVPQTLKASQKDAHRSTKKTKKRKTDRSDTWSVEADRALVETVGG